MIYTVMDSMMMPNNNKSNKSTRFGYGIIVLFHLFSYTQRIGDWRLLPLQMKWKIRDAVASHAVKRFINLKRLILHRLTTIYILFKSNTQSTFYFIDTAIFSSTSFVFVFCSLLFSVVFHHCLAFSFGSYQNNYVAQQVSL